MGLNMTKPDTQTQTDTEGVEDSNPILYETTSDDNLFSTSRADSFVGLM